MYIKYWFISPNIANAPQNEFIFIKYLKVYENKTLAKIALEYFFFICST